MILDLEGGLQSDKFISWKEHKSKMQVMHLLYWTPFSAAQTPGKCLLFPFGIKRLDQSLEINIKNVTLFMANFVNVQNPNVK